MGRRVIVGQNPVNVAGQSTSLGVVRVGRGASGAALGALIVIALGLSASPAGAGSPKHPAVSIVSVRAVPADTQAHGGTLGSLVSSKVNTVTVSSTLAFEIEIRNDGTSRKQGLSTSLLISRSAVQGGPLVKLQTLAEIGPRQTRLITHAQHLRLEQL